MPPREPLPEEYNLPENRFSKLPDKSELPKQRFGLKKSLAAATVALLAAIGVVSYGQSQENKSDIDPVELTDHSEPAHSIEINGLPVGAQVQALNGDIEIDPTQVNVRTSPNFVDSEFSSNKVAAGQEPFYVVNPIVIEETSNGQWYGFADKDGQMSWVHAEEQGVRVVEDETLPVEEGAITPPPTGVRTYTITHTTDRGITAQDQDAQAALIGTVVELS